MMLSFIIYNRFLSFKNLTLVFEATSYVQSCANLDFELSEINRIGIHGDKPGTQNNCAIVLDFIARGAIEEKSLQMPKARGLLLIVHDCCENDDISE